MRYPVYLASEWIKGYGVPFIYSHALNRALNPEPHCHDFYEIIFLFSGNATHCVNDVSYEMQEGDVALLRPFDTHIFLAQSQRLELYSISVVAEEFGPLFTAYHINLPSPVSKKEIHFSICRGQQYEMLSAFGQLESKSNSQRESQIRILMGLTLHEYMRLQSQDSTERIDRILSQMNAPENMAAGVSALLTLSNLSHAQLCRLVKKRTGQTPQHYIKELRLSCAYDMIRSTDMTYEEIALHVGYSSFSHFSVVFKQRYGFSPSTLRRSLAHTQLI